jgi:hypothetical protein
MSDSDKIVLDKIELVMSGKVPGKDCRLIISPLSLTFFIQWNRKNRLIGCPLDIIWHIGDEKLDKMFAQSGFLVKLELTDCFSENTIVTRYRQRAIKIRK